MHNSRVKILCGIAALLAVIVVWKWVAGWGLVTVDFTDAPLARVIKALEKQGKVKIVTNADLTAPTSLYLKRVPIHDAVDTLAVRIDGDARLAYVAAPTRKEITGVLAAFAANSNPGGWVAFGAGGGGGGFGGGGGPMSSGETIIDQRLIEWQVSPSEDKTLQTLLQQGAQKTGVLFATPQEWNPVLTKIPKEGKAGKIAANLVKNAKGELSEVYLLTVRPPRPAGEERRAAQGEGGPPRWEGQRTVFSPQRRGGNANPEWMAERAQAQIKLLPEGERAQAQKDYNDMRAFWESVRNLPEDQRREKIQEMMNNPEVQERMEERMAARDSKRTPEQRERRMKTYVERKSQMKNASAQ